MQQRVSACVLLVVVSFAYLVSPDALATASDVQQDEAKAFVQRVSDQAIVLLRQEDDDPSHDLRILFEQTFDLETIGRLAIGKVWRELEVEQKERYQKSFRHLVLHKYLRRLTDLKGVTIMVQKVTPAGRRDVLVTTAMARPQQPDVVVGWRIREFDSGHHVIDMTIEGISMVITQRDGFAELIQIHSPEGFIVYLEDKVDS